MDYHSHTTTYTLRLYFNEGEHDEHTHCIDLWHGLVLGGRSCPESRHMPVGKADENTPINDAWLTAKTKIAAVCRRPGSREARSTWRAAKGR